MSNNEVDLVVIGAGATGATIAYEATKRGLTVALLDSGDIAGATSCRSSKLLHGGVRYLELAFKTLDLAQLKLVREALLERRHWLEQAPFLASRLELALPSEGIINKAYHRIGLGIYDALSGREGIGSSRLLSSQSLQQIIPLIKDRHSGGIVYSDGQFNDARLNLLLALTAEKAGSVIRNYCQVVGFERKNDGTLQGVVTQNMHGQQERWTSKAIVNATGIYADKLRTMSDPDVAPRILTSRGIHIVLENNLCPAKIGLLIPSTNDGRVLFILPFFGRTLIGTTDTLCEVADARKISNSEKEYLMSHVKEWFPSLQEVSIKSAWAGGRPLIKPSKDLQQSSRVVREHIVETLPCGLISAMGGKWTTCRIIAQDTLKAVEALIGTQLKPPIQLPLIGASKNRAATRSLLTQQSEILRQYLPETPIKEKQLSHLQTNYGLKALEIIANSPKECRRPLSNVIPLCHAEISQAIKSEHAKTPTDILARRCRLAMIDIQEAERLVPIVQECLTKSKLPINNLNLEQ